MIRKTVLIVALLLSLVPLVAEDEAVDDLSNEAIAYGQGYLASSRDVLENTCYWQEFEKSGKLKMLQGMSGLSTEDTMLMYADEFLEAEQTDWLFSERSAILLKLKTDDRRQSAIQWWRSGRKYQIPGNTKARKSRVSLSIHARSECR